MSITANFKKNRWLLLVTSLFLAGLCGPLCIQAQETAAGKTISQKKFQRLSKKKNSVVLDVRTIEEYKAGHIPNAVQTDVLKKEDFKARVAGLDKNKIYLVYCRSGKRSKDAMNLMKEMGFTRLYDLDGGFSGWTGAKEY